MSSHVQELFHENAQVEFFRSCYFTLIYIYGISQTPLFKYPYVSLVGQDVRIP